MMSYRQTMFPLSPLFDAVMAEQQQISSFIDSCHLNYGRVEKELNNDKVFFLWQAPHQLLHRWNMHILDITNKQIWGKQMMK